MSKTDVHFYVVNILSAITLTWLPSILIDYVSGKSFEIVFTSILVWFLILVISLRKEKDD